ncbi:hypothetical protein [Rhodococcus opacus]|uniref:hypothetical protein n=1 Tax=Rhodococcus opacus TaxID=37919 RepID=UPI001C481CBF|nr:hypothetical protein [Rhodococcus opacus]MBV6759868.1 hypothetical protein [Rhodococcus opacus]
MHRNDEQRLLEPGDLVHIPEERVVPGAARVSVMPENTEHVVCERPKPHTCMVVE